MTSTSAPAAGSAGRHGPLWGARAADWALNERQQVPTYEAAIRRAGIGPGTSVLDVGCGAGTFLRVAADHGATVAGLDASARLLALAGEHVPEARLHQGDLQALPFADGAFDVVTGFNSFFFAADMVAALREARRVARRTVVVQVWGPPDRCDLTAMKRALAGFQAPPGPDAPPPPALWEPGALEDLAAAAGLRPRVAFDVRWPYEFADADVLGRALLAPGLVVEVLQRAGEQAVRSAIVEALERFREPDGSYRLFNEWRVLIADAG